MFRKRYVSIRFLCGMNTPDGRAVPAWNRGRALAVFSAEYEAGGVYTGQGYWKGAAEPCAMLETIQPDSRRARKRARLLANWLAIILKQDAIGLVFTPVRFELIPQPKALTGRALPKGGW